jgi:SAM-dependent methyltransferase
MRYMPIARLIEQERAGGEKILEVGSGPKGVTAYLLDKAVVAVDVDFDGSYGFASSGCFPVRATAETLPFRDEAFPFVVCVDVLEHIRPERRERVIGELLRVARGKVYLAFPVRGSCEAWEKLLFRLHMLWRNEVPGWLREHVDNGLPEESEVATFLGENGRIFRIVPNENNVVHFVVMLVDEFIWPGNRIGEVMAPRRWKFKEHGLSDNLLRALLFGFRYLPSVANFGTPVRKLFIVGKRGSPAPET